MEFTKIIFTSLGSVIILFILTKLMGHRQMSQLTMFDFINGITIGSIAAEMATAIEDDFRQPLIAMVVYSTIVILISFFTNKSMMFRRLISGKPLILYNKGTLYRENLKKAKLDVSELLVQCRISGYFNIADIQTAVLEQNGKISFLPNSQKRPVTPEDLNLSAQQEQAVSNVIIDGKIIKNNLTSTGNNIDWLTKKLKEQNISNVSDIFLATCDIGNNLSVYTKTNKDSTNSFFE